MNLNNCTVCGIKWRSKDSAEACCWRETIAKLRRENARLRKLVAKLPVSGDEIPIVPMSKVWVKGKRETVSLVNKNYVTLSGVYGDVNAFDCFFRKPEGGKK